MGGHPGRFRVSVSTWVVTQADSSPRPGSPRPISVSRPGWSPRPIRTRMGGHRPNFVSRPGFTQADSSPTCFGPGGHPGRFVPVSNLGGHPGRFVFRFETWVVTQADSSPIRLRFETWVVTQADSYPNHKFRFETWVVTQADSSPIRLRFETWVVVSQADSGGPQADSSPTRPGWSPRPIRPRITNFVSRPGWSPRPIRKQVSTWVLPHATFGSSRAPPVKPESQSERLTPWHKEHSDGLRSQGSYLANPSSPLCKACTVEKVGSASFPTIPRSSKSDIGSYVYHARENRPTKIRLLLKFPELSHRRCHACAQSLPDSQQVDLRARAHWKEDTSMHDVELSDRQEFIGVSRNPDRKTALKRTKNTPRKLSDGTKNVKIRHRELGQICARTGTRFEKKRAGSKTHFFSRTAAFARRVFPARNKLIREPGCVGKIMTPATSWNSRFAESIPRLIGIFTGRVHENSSDTPTSGSHNSLVRTPIRANFISLERGRRELSDDMPHDPF
uniref:Uncharacterized protein n=1 Tax=Fagus sylvatica TaxID=28930 RepID=A0A2N9GIB8_FAGSY